MELFNGIVSQEIQSNSPILSRNNRSHQLFGISNCDPECMTRASDIDFLVSAFLSQSSMILVSRRHCQFAESNKSHFIFAMPFSIGFWQLTYSTKITFDSRIDEFWWLPFVIFRILHSNCDYSRYFRCPNNSHRSHWNGLQLSVRWKMVEPLLMPLMRRPISLLPNRHSTESRPKHANVSHAQDHRQLFPMPCVLVIASAIPVVFQPRFWLNVSLRLPARIYFVNQSDLSGYIYWRVCLNRSFRILESIVQLMRVWVRGDYGICQLWVMKCTCVQHCGIHGQSTRFWSLFTTSRVA